MITTINKAQCVVNCINYSKNYMFLPMLCNTNSNGFYFILFLLFFASDFAENLIENNKDSFVCLFVSSFIHSLTEGTVFLLFVCFFH